MANGFLAYYLSHHISYDWKFNFLAYLMPGYLALFFLCTLILLFLKRWILLLTCLICFFFLIKPIGETFSLGYYFDKPTGEGEEINLFTFNASGFNSNRDDIFMPDDSIFRTDFISYLRSLPEKPDILCFQEFHHDDGERLRLTDEIVKITQTPYYYSKPVWQSEQDGFFGIITFSCYPIVNKGILYLGESSTLNRGIFTDLAIGKDTVRVINIHLHSMSIRLGDTAAPTFVDKAKMVYNKMKEGEERRKDQLLQVLENIEKSPYPVILAGDFNSFPYGYAYQSIKTRLENTFEKSGLGFGYTINIFPYMVRLDNVFISSPLKAISTNVVRKFPSSDHLALLAKIKWPKDSKQTEPAK